MRTLILLPLIVLLAGCSTTNITELSKALAHDPAIVSAKVATVYGTAQLVRVGAVTNGTAVTVSPDGTVTVKAP